MAITKGAIGRRLGKVPGANAPEGSPAEERADKIQGQPLQKKGTQPPWLKRGK